MNNIFANNLAIAVDAFGWEMGIVAFVGVYAMLAAVFVPYLANIKQPTPRWEHEQRDA